MSVTSKTYEVNNFKQLIELNGNKTNFDLSFEVKSENDEPFKALVISETDLNSGNQINYQDVKDGYISGNIKNDKGVFQTYFLLLKTDNDKIVNCTVTLDLKDIPLNPEVQKYINEQNMNIQNRNIQNRDNQNRIRQQQILNQNRVYNDNNIVNTNIKHHEHKKEGINWVLWIGICVLVGVGIWLFITKSKKTNTELPKLEVPKLEVPKPELPKPELPKPELPKLETPKLETPKFDSNIINSDLNLEVPKLDGLDVIKSDSGIGIELPKINTNKNDGLMRKLNNFFDS
jgi:hypothetical protein